MAQWVAGEAVGCCRGIRPFQQWIDTVHRYHHAMIRRTAGRRMPKDCFERATAAAPLKDRALELLLA